MMNNTIFEATANVVAHKYNSKQNNLVIYSRIKKIDRTQ